MQRAGCSGSPSCCSSRCTGAARQTGRYKTMENFLRRMAFNLGNTVSQTDVKILSCIPIDVTDLQQKIIELEKELAKAKGTENKKDEAGGEKNVATDQGKNGEKKDDETKEGDDKETKVMRMQMKNSKVEIKTDTGSLSAGPDYLKDFLNIDSTNELQSLYKAARKHEAQIENKLKYPHCTSNSDLVSSHHSIHKIKSCKNNPFRVVIGNIKKRNNVDPAKYDLKVHRQKADQLDNSGSSYSIILPHTKTKLTKECPDRKTDDVFKEDNVTNSKLRRKISKKSEKMYPAFFPRNQYVYYAQTNSPFNPGFKNDNYDCDLTYIANLIEKQYAPINFHKGSKDLNRQFSVPVCRDSVDILGSKYAISGIAPCSCCPGTSSDYNIKKIYEPIQDKYKEYIQTNINGRFNDTTMYDIIPVKQKSTTKHLDPISCEKNPHRARTRRPHTPFKSFVNIDPPLNLHPTRSLETMYDTENSKDVSCSHYTRHEKSICLANNLKRKNNYSPRYSSSMKPQKEKKSTLEPEDIYMTKKLRPAETSSLTNIRDNYSDYLEAAEEKPNETVAELKTILQDFLKEIKEDFPKNNESPNIKEKDAHNAPIPQQASYAFVPNFPQIMQPPQCCCPVLCPINYISDAYKAHPPGLCSLPRNPSQCFVHNNVTKNENDWSLPKQDVLIETKRLIEEIYNSMSLQKEEQAEKKFDITHNENACKINTENENKAPNSHDILECKVHKKNQCMQSVDPISSEQSSETISKELTRNSETSPSSESSVPNVPEISDDRIKNTKKGKLANIMKIMKSVSFKKQSNTPSECEIKSQYYEKPPFKQNITQSKTAKSKHGGKLPKMYANHNVNTENRPEDIYKCCYFDKEAERMRSCAHPPAPMSQWSPKCHRMQDEPLYHRSPHLYNGSCFCMPEPQQIPFCLKEIEVRNTGTQSIKKKKMFAIFKKLRGGSDSESVPSYENYQPRRLPQNFIMQDKQKKKGGFWQTLKGDKDFDPDQMYDYNFIDTGKKSSGMKQAPPSFNSKKRSGTWAKYMNRLENTKKSDLASHMVNRNPLSFKNVVMRTLIGQKPEPNTKAARAFF